MCKEYVQVKCPECGKTVNGIKSGAVGMPFNNYNAYCKDCDYHIGESEFEEVEE